MGDLAQHSAPTGNPSRRVRTDRCCRCFPARGCAVAFELLHGQDAVVVRALRAFEVAQAASHVDHEQPDGRHRGTGFVDLVELLLIAGYHAHRACSSDRRTGFLGAHVGIDGEHCSTDPLGTELGREEQRAVLDDDRDDLADLHAPIGECRTDAGRLRPQRVEGDLVPLATPKESQRDGVRMGGRLLDEPSRKRVAAHAPAPRYASITRGSLLISAGRPSAIFSPKSRTMIRSATSITMRMSCSIRTIEMPRASLISRM